MIPLNIAPMGEELVIKKISGDEAVKQHLKDLGFLVGGTCTVVQALSGNVIINVKESRLAISEGMARKIMV